MGTEGWVALFTVCGSLVAFISYIVKWAFGRLDELEKTKKARTTLLINNLNTAITDHKVVLTTHKGQLDELTRKLVGLETEIKKSVSYADEIKDEIKEIASSQLILASEVSHYSKTSEERDKQMRSQIVVIGKELYLLKTGKKWGDDNGSI